MSSCRTTCPYCGVGCGVTAQVDGETVVAVSGDESHPANSGRLCVKGTALAETMTADGRLLNPMLAGEMVDWDHALDVVAQKIGAVRKEFGPGAIGFYLSGQLLTEDYYVANKLMKGFLGSANVDTNSRLCMSSAVAGYKRAFGADFVPCTYDDLETCDLLVMVGSNAAWTHPVVYQRIIESRRANPEKRIVVIDPRHTATCDTADLHLQIQPGSDGYLFVGLLHYLRRAGKLNYPYIEQHTQGLDDALTIAADFSLPTVAEVTGLDLHDLESFYQLFAATEKTVTLYSQGINQSATGADKCNAIINCHLATARLGRPSMGPFSITGQPNAMGGREVGGLANQLAAHMDFSADSIERVERFWRAPDMAREAGLKAVDMFRAIDAGEIRFLWIMATNPAVSLPDTALVRSALAKCDFVVVSDCVGDTDTAAYANLLLPAAGWGEKSGTVTNSERCISRQRSLVPPTGEAKPDWWIITQVARRLGFGQAFDYQSPAQIFSEHAQLSGFENNGSRDFDISGLADLSEHQYDHLPPTYWPCAVSDSVDGPTQNGRFFTASGRANFIAVSPALPVVDSASDGHLTLNTGRLRDQWHTMTRTGRVPRLMRHRDFFSVSISAEDAQLNAVVEGSLIRLYNELGSVSALAQVEGNLSKGQVFSPIHWSDQYSGSACINGLIPALTDPISGQPQSKFARVSLASIAVRSWGLLLTRDLPDLPSVAYWSRISVAGGYLTLLAEGTSDMTTQLRRDFLEPLQSKALRNISYQDGSAQDYRELGVDGNQLSYAAFFSADRNRLPTLDWLSGLLARSNVEDPAAMLAGFDPNTPEKGRLICTCWEVGEQEIERALVAGACSVEALGQELRCGTQCGSCVPELKRMLHKPRNQCAA